MKKSFYLCATFFSLLPLALPAQNAVEIAQKADELFAAGKISEAAGQYEIAGRLNGNDFDLLYKAAEAYYRIRDYRKAAACYVSLKGAYGRFELAGLRYARALKQDGRYDDAIEAFRQFARDYRGERKAQVIGVVTNEIKGCELALQMAKFKASPVLPAQVKILPATVNTAENDFAPIPFSENVLYFSTIEQGQVKLMRTLRESGVWQEPTAAQGLPEAAAYRFGNGVFSPDGNRFYCTQCTEPNSAGRGGIGLRAQCSLYVLRRNADGEWSAPERLRDYINMPNRTVTHPFVTHDRGRELLFFASDREGGAGGLDIYVCERPLDSEELDFSFPQNLGNAVNTAGDEVTPFFDAASQTLWFSSNGHLSLGGLDVFKSVRSESKWSSPENAGLPVNSPADDFFFTLKKNNTGGFVVSNRLFGTTKLSTSDEDIFEFFPTEPPVTLNGRVLERGSNQLLTDCMVALYEGDAGTEQRLMEVHPSQDGAFQFYVLAGRRYRVEATKDGYATASATADESENDIVVAMSPSAGNPLPVFTSGKGADAPNGFSDLSAAGNGLPPGSLSANASYKIHLEVQPDFDASASRYDLARNFGKVIAEPMPAQGIVRILLGDFDDQRSANEVAVALRKSGSFPQAFVVKETGSN